MATVARTALGIGPPRKSKGAMHRIRAVRQEQGISIRTAARQLGADARTLKQQEQETSDLRLSDLYRWQEVLDVPVTDLLVDPGTSLSAPVLERARLVRLMKTAAAIRERSVSPGVRRMAQMLVDQLVELMPELAEVSAWHSIGRRRSLEEMGRAAEQPVATDLLRTFTYE